MSSFFGAGLAWLETDETPAATATAAIERGDGETAKQSAHRPPFVMRRVIAWQRPAAPPARASL